MVVYYLYSFGSAVCTLGDAGAGVSPCPPPPGRPWLAPEFGGVETDIINSLFANFDATFKIYNFPTFLASTVPTVAVP